MTALQGAAHYGHDRAAEVLLDAGADIDHVDTVRAR
jgi:ankyrin repeat protein